MNSSFTLYLHFIYPNSPGHKNFIMIFQRCLWYSLLKSLKELSCSLVNNSSYCFKVSSFWRIWWVKYLPTLYSWQMVVCTFQKRHGRVYLFIYLNVFSTRDRDSLALCSQSTKAHSYLFCAYLILIQVSITDFFNKSDIKQFVIHFLLFPGVPLY